MGDIVIKICLVVNINQQCYSLATMNHISHIAKNREILEARFQITRLIREFFWSEGFLEVETPNIVNVPGQEPYLSPIKINVQNEIGQEYSAYLHTSPEYTMKKMLAAGFGDIFSISKCYRDQESFGGLHNPEFTMLEWYRVEADMSGVMEDVGNLFDFIFKELEKFQISEYEFQNMNFRRIHMRDLWQEYVGVNLDDYLDIESLRQLFFTAYSLPPTSYTTYEDLFYRIFLNEIEPKLVEPTIVHHYPAQMAALAKISKDDPRYAERFEVYINGVELANAFTELTDSNEQLKRLKEEQSLRKDLGKEVYDIDMEFVEAVGKLSNCAGIALGVDRLVQAMLGVENIDDVLVLPMPKLF